MRQLEIYIDGASKGNPGHAGIGVVICQDGQVLKNISSYIGESTNNVAEYTALIQALQEALILKAESIAVNTDSQLLYRQMRGEYKVKHPLISSLYTQAAHLASAFKEVRMKQISRENNRGADKLATLAIKQALKKQPR
jgi:ribonuclease HI